jgi:hypothetical protein
MPLEDLLVPEATRRAFVDSSRFCFEVEIRRKPVVLAHATMRRRLWVWRSPAYPRRYLTDSKFLLLASGIRRSSKPSVISKNRKVVTISGSQRLS